jgi:hypothetical protein
MNDAHLVEGLLVCGRCADRLRARTRWALGTAVGLIGWIAITSWGGAWALYDAYGPWKSAWPYVVLGLPPIIALGAAAGYVRRMRGQNRRALESLGRSRLLNSEPAETPALTSEPHGA